MRQAIRDLFSKEDKYKDDRRYPYDRNTSPASTHRAYGHSADTSRYERIGEFYATRQRPGFGAFSPVESSFPSAMSERERMIRDDAIRAALRQPSATQFGTIHAPDYSSIEQSARLAANRGIGAARASWHSAHPYAPADSMPSEITHSVATSSTAYILERARIEAGRRASAAARDLYPYV